MPITAADLIRSPEHLPHSIDLASERLLLLRLTEAGYADASFLDGRMLTPQARGEWIGWPALEAALAGVVPPRPCHMIFHIGHVGSTLLSRLIGRAPGVSSLREPEALRTLADLAFDAEAPESPWSSEVLALRTALLMGLWSRTWRAEQRAVLKATSFVAERAAAVLAEEPRRRAVLMVARPEVYLATILGAESSPLEMRTLAPRRLRRLHRRLGGPAWRLWELSPGEMAAMSWACETTALFAAAEVAGGRAMWLDFDDLLAEPAPALARVLAHLERSAADEVVRAIVEGPELRRYSKAPEHAYDAALRARVLAQARELEGAEIARGLAWLDRAATLFPAIARARELLG